VLLSGRSVCAPGITANTVAIGGRSERKTRCDRAPRADKLFQEHRRATAAFPSSSPRHGAGQQQKILIRAVLKEAFRSDRLDRSSGPGALCRSGHGTGVSVDASSQKRLGTLRNYGSYRGTFGATPSPSRAATLDVI
jgi:hypothetical protein